MTLDTLVERLKFLREIHGGEIKVVLDDFYTPACLDTEDIYPEKRNGNPLHERVLVIRS